MSKTIYNKQSVAEADAARSAKIADLMSEVSFEEAEEAFRYMKPSELADHCPAGAVIGVFRKARKGDYGFIGDCFVNPSLVKDLKDGFSYAAKTAEGRKGLYAVRIAPYDKYVYTWHRQELVESVRRDLQARRKEEAEWLSKQRSLSSMWEEMLLEAASVGFTLIEAAFETASTSYGGRGVDSYVVAEAIDEIGANRLIDALHRRHEERGNTAPYDHGHDNITLTVGGFTNRWCGPWTD